MRSHWLPLIAICLGLGFVTQADAQDSAHVSNNLVDNTRSLFIPGALAGQERSSGNTKLGKVTYLNPKSSKPIRIAKVFPPLNNETAGKQS